MRWLKVTKAEQLIDSRLLLIVFELHVRSVAVENRWMV